MVTVDETLWHWNINGQQEDLSILLNSTMDVLAIRELAYNPTQQLAERITGFLSAGMNRIFTGSNAIPKNIMPGTSVEGNARDCFCRAGYYVRRMRRRRRHFPD